MDEVSEPRSKIIAHEVVLDFINGVFAKASHAAHELRSRGMEAKAIEVEAIRKELASFRDRYHRTDIEFQSAIKNVRAWAGKNS